MSYDIYHIRPKGSCVIYMTFLLKIEFLYFAFCHKLHRPVIFKLCLRSVRACEVGMKGLAR